MRVSVSETAATCAAILGEEVLPAVDGLTAKRLRAVIRALEQLCSSGDEQLVFTIEENLAILSLLERIGFADSLNHQENQRQAPLFTDDQLQALRDAPSTNVALRTALADVIRSIYSQGAAVRPNPERSLKEIDTHLTHWLMREIIVTRTDMTAPVFPEGHRA